MNHIQLYKLYIRLISVLLCIPFVTIILWAENNQNPPETKKLFEEKYEAWYKCCLGQTSKSLHYSYYNNDYFRDIVALGIPALPYIIEKSIDTSAVPQHEHTFSIFRAACLITKANLFITLKEVNGKQVEIISGFPYITQKVNENSGAMWMRWWYEGRKEIPQYFEMTYNEWEGAKEEGKDNEAQKKYQQIRKMGIFALPYIMEKISKGDDELIPMVSELTDGEVKENAKPEDCINWWQQNKEKWYIPIEDEPIEKIEEGEEEIKKDEKE